MARGPSPTPQIDSYKLSTLDIVDEIRRHVRTVARVKNRGGAKLVLQGREVEIEKVNLKELKSDLAAALKELKQLQVQLSEGQPSQKYSKR